jgi:hypothetical protein
MTANQRQAPKDGLERHVISNISDFGWHYYPLAGLFVLLHSLGDGESEARLRLASRPSAVATSCRRPPREFATDDTAYLANNSWRHRRRAGGMSSDA